MVYGKKCCGYCSFGVVVGVIGFVLCLYSVYFY